MIKVTIESAEGVDYFFLNGIKRPRAYEAIGVNLLDGGQGVKIIPAQREGVPIQDTILFDEYQIDGYIPETQEQCISALNEIVFKKGGGNGTGVAIGKFIVPIDTLIVFKVAPNSNNDLQESGDFCVGFVEGTFIQAPYTGGNQQLLTSYDVGQ